MAILKDFNKQVPGLSQPLVVKAAYWRILEIQGGKEELNVSVEIRETSESDATIGLFAFVFKPDPSGENYHAQAYEHLKTLDAFKDAVDS